MKSKCVIFGILLTACLVLLAVVVPAQARETPVAVPVSGDELANGMVLATVGIQANGGQATNAALYDSEWNLVAQTPGFGGVFSFGAVKPGAYHLVANNDVLETWAEKEIQVKPGETLQVSLYLRRMAAQNVETSVETKVEAPVVQPAAAAILHTTSSCGGATGDGGLLKVYASYGQTIIYLQCGRVVGRVESGGCGSCSASGGWRYTTDCKKTTPIYVTLPCNRGRH